MGSPALAPVSNRLPTPSTGFSPQPASPSLLHRVRDGGDQVDTQPRPDLRPATTSPGALDAPRATVSVRELASAQRAAVLVGTNDPARDVETLQTAANNGGTYVLQGTFDLGETGSIDITKDVAFRGAPNADGPGATIRNGTWAFYARLPAGPITQPGPAIDVRNIAFDGVAGAPLHAAYSSKIVFNHNDVRNVRPLQVGSYLRASGAVIGTRDAQNGNGAFVPGAVTGPIEVRGNRIDLKVPSPKDVNGTGAQIQFADAADAIVAGNVFTNYSRNCADALDNRGGRVVFSGNQCISDKEGSPQPTPRTPNGIIVGWFFDKPAENMGIAERQPHYSVLNNKITVNGTSSFGVGAMAPRAVVEGNRIHVGGGAEAVGILTIAPGSWYLNNRISGSGQAAVMVASPMPGVVAAGNVYSNDTSRFMPSQAHYVLAKGTKDNTILDPSGRVVDNGANRVEMAP